MAELQLFLPRGPGPAGVPGVRRAGRLMDEPRFLVLGEMPHDRAAWGLGEGDPMPLDPDRWAEERQYQRNDALAARLPLFGDDGKSRWPSSLARAVLPRPAGG